MTISEKIYKYMEIKDMKVQTFSELLGINRTTLSAMLNERNRFSQDFFEALCLKCPDIDLNRLLNPDHDNFLQKTTETPDKSRIKELESYIKEIKKIVSKSEI